MGTTGCLPEHAPSSGDPLKPSPLHLNKALLARFLAAGALLTLFPPALCAQEYVAGKPPVYQRVERARVILSPLTSVRMQLDLGDQPDPTSDTVEGAGLSLGADFIVHRYVSIWIDGHAGAVTAVKQKAEGASTSLQTVTGSFRMAAVGASGVLSTGEVTGLLGVGLFAAAADWEGFNNALGRDVETDATLVGVLATLRGDYTFRNGFFIGAGVDLGAGAVGGQEGSDADSPTGTLIVLYLPLGWTY
jgi:hypothetical protein